MRRNRELKKPRMGIFSKPLVKQELPMSDSLADVLSRVRQRDPDQPEFLQALEEVLGSLWPFLDGHPQYREQGLIERLLESAFQQVVSLPGMAGSRINH